MLIDAHIHMALNNLYTRQAWEISTKNQKIVWIREILKQYKERNIFILRDGGDGIFVSRTVREVAASEDMIYKSPIYALYKRGYYGSFLGKPIDGIKDFKEEFKILLDNKLDHLKIILTDIVRFSSYGDVGDTTFTTDELNSDFGTYP